jgi:hypothetical protein
MIVRSQFPFMIVNHCPEGRGRIGRQFFGNMDDQLFSFWVSEVYPFTSGFDIPVSPT